MKLRDIPNIICVLRIILVFPIAIYIYSGDYNIAFYLFLIAGFSDGLDGYLAKQYGWQSRLGSILDPIADKLLLVTIFVMIGYVGLVPIWLVAIVFLRDLLIVTGGYIYFRFIGYFQMAPSLISKLNTVTQIFLIAAILSLNITRIPDEVIDYVVVITLCTTILSGLDYAFVWSRKAIRATRK